jgi:cytochrome P450 family 150 subfamily A5
MMVTGYDEAMQVYNDPESFSSCISVTGPQRPRQREVP